MDGADTWKMVRAIGSLRPFRPRLRFDPEGVLYFQHTPAKNSLNYLAHSADAPEVLLQLSKRGKNADAAKVKRKHGARWVCPDVLLRDPYGSGPGVYAAAMHKGTLWMLTEGVKEDEGLARLYIFRKGEDEGKSMPIYMDISGTELDASCRANLPQDSSHNSYFFNSSLFILPAGVGIRVAEGALPGRLWYIPFSDLPEDWRDRDDQAKGGE